MTSALSPRGTLRSRFEPQSGADMFRRLGVGARCCDLGDEGLYLAEELVAADRWFGGRDPLTLGVLVLALMIAQRQGSTCLPLDPSPRGHLRTLVTEIARLAGIPDEAPALLRAIGKLTGMPQFDSVVGTRDQRLPLIVDGGCLYTERARWLEDRVARRLTERLGAPAPARASATASFAASGTASAAAAGAAAADLARRPGAAALSDEQMHAVRLAFTGRLTVVTGGPGTGKTVVAAAIVRGFARLGIGPIALAAQTGKAANRLTEVIAHQLAAIRDPSDADRALAAAPPVAQTLHRLLGYRGERFAHHAQSPLPFGAVIVDEASMIDLELMDALLDALPASAPLVLIGDAHQLPAIDAGQILADLAGAPSGDGPAAARVGVLAASYRMNTSDPGGRAVYDAAAAVHDGAVQRLVERAHPLAIPRTPGTLTFGGVEWVEPTAGRDPQATAVAVAEGLWHHFEGPRALRAAERVFHFHDGRVDPAERADLEQLWQLLARARVLTVTRALPTGSYAINAHLHERALERMSVTGHPELVPGEPVMITANDYQRGLFNGDQGIVVRADEGLGRHHYRAVFRTGGELRPFAIEALRDHLELSWALTVHKSQGSELDAIALILPPEDLPLVTRELLYTGITRARTGVAIVGSRNLVLTAGKRRALRYSGLANRLRASVRP